MLSRMVRRRGHERARAQALRAGRSIRLARLGSGLTRQAAAGHAGMACSTWQRVEAGTPSVTLANFVAAAAAVGLDFVCRTYPGRAPGLRDSGQLHVVTWLRSVAHPSWRGSLEERAGDHGEAVDLVLWGGSEIMAIEVERRLVDWQDQLRRWLLKLDWLDAQHARPVRLVVVVADTRGNRSALAPFRPILRETFPAGTRAVMAALRNGTPLGMNGLCWVRQRR